MYKVGFHESASSDIDSDFFRCPTECRLSRSKEPWKCIVSLRLIVDKNGRTISPVQNITFGEPILNPDDVEDHLRRAQKAVLCPSTPASQFLFPADIDSMSSELSFSPNFVSVAISGPNIADLSFCDLPGSSKQYMLYYSPIHFGCLVFV